MSRLTAIFAAVVLTATRSAAGADPAASPTVAFDGFGLGDLSAAASVARVLRETPGSAAEPGSVPLDVVVRGPGRGVDATAPLAAEVRGRIEGIDVAAGMQGDAEALASRTPRWTGRLGVGTDGPDGSRSVEVRTLLESRAGTGRVGVEIGPRIERRLGRNARVFLDGSASAEASRAVDAGGAHLPGTSTADSATAVGVSARTGIVR
ncbi:MAG: hypothetical protein ACKOSQ_12590 [Planctomycetaceae bacterium]